jgi:hypothetical protein
MLQFRSSDENQVVFAHRLTGIAHHTPTSSGILHEVQFADIVTMDGVIEFRLVPIGHIHEVMFGQWRYFVQYSSFHEGEPFLTYYGAKIQIKT